MANNNFYEGFVKSIDDLRVYNLSSGGQGTEQCFWLSVEEISGFKSAKYFSVRNSKVSIPEPKEDVKYKVYFDIISYPAKNGGAFTKAEVWKIEPVGVYQGGGPNAPQYQGSAAPAQVDEVLF